MKSAVVLALALIISLTTFAVMDVSAATVLSPPHDISNGYTCANCHTLHKTLGSTGYNNICLNCHRAGEPKAGSKPFKPSDQADPFGRYTAFSPALRYQTSHRWDGSDTNPAAGAQPPVQAAMTTNRLRERTGGKMACVRCHDQHSQAFPPFLRVANDRDQLCLDCHRSRDRRDHTTGTHPVNFTYTSASSKVKTNPAGYHPAPLNANPGNASSALPLKGGALLCSTCHGIHYSDSNSATFDSFSSFPNLTPSAGNLLRTDLRGASADAVNICSSCHAGKVSHNNRGQDIQCGDCHGGHVDTGDGSTPNVWLVKRAMNGSSVPVLFPTTAIKNYMDASGNGVCQACHPVPTGSGYQFHLTQTNATCNDCHTHGNQIGSFSVDLTKACGACHGYPPRHNVAGPGGYAVGSPFTNESTSGHFSHATAPYQKACTNCHQGNTHQAGTFQDVFKDTAGTVAATGGLQPTYDPLTLTCTSVYCHSNANPSGGTNVTTTTPSWSGGRGAIIGQPGECGFCHSRAGDPAPSWSVSHTRHINDYGITGGNANFSCTTCHALTAAGNGAIFNTMTARSLHTNGIKDIVFGDIAANGSWNGAAATCTNLYCHSNVQGSAGSGSPSSFTPDLAWNGPAMTCISCHPAMVIQAAVSTATGSHKRHVQGYPYDCAICHGAGYSKNGTVATATHVDKIINIGFTGTAVNNGAIPIYHQWNNPPGGGYASCTNVYCHSTVQGSTGTGSPTGYAVPTWGDQPIICGSCHVNMGVSAAATGSHAKHARTYAFACITCHNGAGKDPSPPFAATPLHANGTINLGFAGNGAGTIYSKGTAVTPGSGLFGSCSATYCHSDGRGNLLTTPQWGVSLLADCTGCHGNNAVSALPLTTGKHGKHTGSPYGFACGRCHATTVTTGNDQLITTISNHVNGVKDVAFDSFNPAATPGSCNNLYCHGTGRATGSILLTAWSDATTLGCKGCHGNISSLFGEPDYTTGGAGTSNANSHSSSHIVSPASCANCHNQTTATGTTILAGSLLHVNGARDLTFPSTLDAGGAANYIATVKQCANIYCHGTGTTPPWGGAPLACNTCHSAKADDTYWAANSAHNLHWEGTDLPSGYAMTPGNAAGDATTYRFACSSCHSPAKGAVHAGGPANTNQAAQVFFGYTSADMKGSYNPGTTQSATDNTFKWTDGTCDNTYCHSNGAGGQGQPVGWLRTTHQTDSTIVCTLCHGYISDSNVTMTSRGHDRHVALFGYSCRNCHYGTTKGATITDKTKHVNKNVEVIFDPLLITINSNFTKGTPSTCVIRCHIDPITPKNW